MTTDEISVCFAPELGAAIRAAAAEADQPLSVWLAEAAASKLRAGILTQFLEEWQAEHGVLTAMDIARAEQELALRPPDPVA